MRRLVLTICGLFMLALGTVPAVAQARPPEQPASGPGGKQAAHNAVIKNVYDKDGEEYWLYEPDRPRPRTAPVIVFLHGWGGTNPAVYGAWLDHLVRRGNIVIFPRYQISLLTPISEFTPNALAAIKNALKRLQTENGHVGPELDKFAVVGHSMGGLLTATVTALAAENGLPRVRAMMSVEPGRTWNSITLFNFELPDLSKIPGDTLLLAVAGDNDGVVDDRDAKRVYYESTRVSVANKDFITLVSDSHGKPALHGNHSAPTALDASYDNGERDPREIKAGGGKTTTGGVRERMPARRNNRGATERATGADSTDARSFAARFGTDAMDYYGTWKLFDALCDAAFYGRNRQYALDNTPQQRFMGKWSDGTPVKELKVTDRP
jgi:pimeloyl-ACP methyl ester carboxylesterase